MRSEKTSKIFAIALSVLMIISLLPLSAFADDAMKVSLTKSSPSSVVQGDSFYVEVTATANAELPYKVILVPADKDIQVLTGESGTITSTEKQKVNFKLMATKGASLGFHDVYVKAVKPGEETTVYGQYKFSVQAAQDMKGYSSMSNFSASISIDADGNQFLTAGQTNNLKVFVFNDGTRYTLDTTCTISGLPTGITLKSGTMKKNLGYYLIGKTCTAEYELEVAEGIKDGSYPLTITITGAYANGEGSLVKESLSETFYIPVKGGKGTGAESYDYKLDYDITGGTELIAGKSNEIDVKITNSGNKAYEKLVSIITLPAGCSLKSGSTRQVVGAVEPGQTVSVKYQVNVDKEASNGSKQFGLLLSGIGNTAVNETLYLPVSGGKTDGEISKSEINPILLLTAYEYGGEAITAGNEFDLTLTLTNTSNKPIQNVKVTVSSEGNSFLPVGSSNSYYISSVGAGASSTKVLHLSCVNDAEQKQTSVTVASSYQDGDGTPFSASDVVTVPVVQATRFEVDEILDPGWLTADSQGFLSVNYYNKGRNQLYNLKISAEGDFTIDGNASQYIGNMAAGRNDYYSLNFWPLQAGPMNGKVIFTFEDAAGNEQIVEKEFNFNIGEAMVWDDPGFGEWEEPQQKKMPLWGWGAIGLGVLIVLIVVLKALKKRKKAKQEALELDD